MGFNSAFKGLISPRRLIGNYECVGENNVCIFSVALDGWYSLSRQDATSLKTRVHKLKKLKLQYNCLFLSPSSFWSSL